LLIMLVMLECPISWGLFFAELRRYFEIWMEAFSGKEAQNVSESSEVLSAILVLGHGLPCTNSHHSIHNQWNSLSVHTYIHFVALS
jgi:hypothetical protein